MAKVTGLGEIPCKMRDPEATQAFAEARYRRQMGASLRLSAGAAEG